MPTAAPVARPAVRAEGTLIAANRDDRTLTYRLLPYNVPGQTNLGRVTVPPGVVELPATPDDLVLNLEHDRARPVGRGVALDDTPDALMATFTIAPTTAGDDLLAEADARLRRGVSVELEGAVIRAGRLTAGRLSWAGAVVAPAFEGATLIAALAPDIGDDPPSSEGAPEADTEGQGGTDGGGRGEGPGAPATATPPPTTPATGDTGTGDDTPDTPDTDDPTGDTTMPATAAAPAPTLPPGTAPASLRGAAVPAQSPRTGPTLAEVNRLMAARAAALPTGGVGRTLYAALADITPEATSVDDITQVPQWLGQLWDGRAYARRYLPLVGSAPLTAMRIAGWRWTVKPVVGPYTGNKDDVPSNAATTEPYSTTPVRIAGAHDVDRIFRDFDVTEFWESYWAAMTESYAQESDVWAWAQIVAAAGAPTAGDAVPAGVSVAAGLIVDGALDVLDVALPTFAVVEKALYRDLLLTRNDDVLAYLNLALGLESGTINSGNFAVVPARTGDLDPGQVLVGARQAVEIRELAGSPIRAEALNIPNGGIDVGLFGYIGAVVHDTDALSLKQDPAVPIVPLADDTGDAGDDTGDAEVTRRVRRGGGRRGTSTITAPTTF